MATSSTANCIDHASVAGIGAQCCKGELPLFVRANANMDGVASGNESNECLDRIERICTFTEGASFGQTSSTLSPDARA
jgi:hypothetical protein